MMSDLRSHSAVESQKPSERGRYAGSDSWSLEGMARGCVRTGRKFIKHSLTSRTHRESMGKSSDEVLDPTGSSLTWTCLS